MVKLKKRVPQRSRGVPTSKKVEQQDGAPIARQKPLITISSVSSSAELPAHLSRGVTYSGKIAGIIFK